MIVELLARISQSIRYLNFSIFTVIFIEKYNFFDKSID